MKLCGSELCVSKNTHVAKCPYSEILLKATCDAGYEKLVLKTAHSTAVNLCTKREENNRPVLSLATSIS
jgi:hypothetical protein